MSQVEMPDGQRVIYKRAKINRLRLDGCKRHRFDVHAIPVALGGKAVCLECGGEMPVLELAQYVRGFMAAGGDPNDVCAGFWPEGVALGNVHCPRCAGSRVDPDAERIVCDLCRGAAYLPVAWAIAYVESL